MKNSPLYVLYMHDQIGEHQVNFVKGFNIDCLHSAAFTMINFNYLFFVEHGRNPTAGS